MKTPNPKTFHQKLIEHMNEAVWVGDKEEKSVYANPKFCKMVGYTLKEIVGRPSYDFWDRKSKRTVQQVNATKRKQGISSSYEGNIVSKKGKKTPVLLNGAPLPIGGTIGIMTDLTELRKKEEIEKTLRTAIHYSTDAIILFDKNKKIKLWNKGAMYIFGYKEKEVLNRALCNIFFEKEVKKMSPMELQHLHNFEFQGKHANNRSLVVAATVTPIFGKNSKKDESKEDPYYLLIGRDITNQVKFEEELKLKEKKIMEAYNEVGIKQRHSDYVFELLELCSNSHTLKNISDFIVSSALFLTRVDACVLRKYNAETGKMDLLSCLGNIEGWKGKASIKYKNSLAQKAFKQNAPIKIVDITSSNNYQSLHLARKNNLCSLFLIPLKFNSQFVGTLSLYISSEKELGIFENNFIKKYAKLIGMVLVNC